MATEKPVLAENGIMIGVSGVHRLVCPKCLKPLEWIEHAVGARPADLLNPDFKDKPADMERASPKEAVCCDTLFLLEAWAHFQVSATPLEVDEPPDDKNG
jgi:hypothetical protein